MLYLSFSTDTHDEGRYHSLAFVRSGCTSQCWQAETANCNFFIWRCLLADILDLKHARDPERLGSMWAALTHSRSPACLGWSLEPRSSVSEHISLIRCIYLQSIRFTFWYVVVSCRLRGWELLGTLSSYISMSVFWNLWCLKLISDISISNYITVFIICILSCFNCIVLWMRKNSLRCVSPVLWLAVIVSTCVSIGCYCPE